MSEILSVFVIIFLASLPGRTTFLLITLTASSAPKKILTGAALAFFLQCLISVLVGEALGLVPQSYVEIAVGLLFLYFARRYWLESRSRVEDGPHSHSVKAIFTSVFMAEFGDVSQLAIATTAAHAASKIRVFLVSVAAMWTILALAIFLGLRIKRLLKPAVMQKVAAAAFLLVGLYFCAKSARGLFF